jgi:hypothetical protein
MATGWLSIDLPAKPCNENQPVRFIIKNQNQTKKPACLARWLFYWEKRQKKQWLFRVLAGRFLLLSQSICLKYQKGLFFALVLT